MQTENTRAFIPRVGTNVKLRTWSDYTSRGISVWSWFKVLETTYVSAYLQVFNGTHQETDVKVWVPLQAIEPPIGWKARYTIHVQPDKVNMVLGWFQRGIRVKVDHALDRLAGDAFMPLDVDGQPETASYGYYTADEIQASDCPSVFTVVAHVQEELHMPKDKYSRQMYRKACRAHGWEIKAINLDAHGYMWYRSKSFTVYQDGEYRPIPSGCFDAPKTALDILWKLRKETQGNDSARHEKAVRGECVPDWVLYRAALWLDGYLSDTHGNSTWMFDPTPDAKDPVNRKR